MLEEKNGILRHSLVLKLNWDILDSCLFDDTGDDYSNYNNNNKNEKRKEEEGKKEEDQIYWQC